MTKLKTTNVTLVAKNLPLLLISTNMSVTGLFIKGSRVERFSENKALISANNKHEPYNNRFYCVV